MQKQPEPAKIDLYKGITSLKFNQITTPTLDEIVKDEIWIVENILSKQECEYPIAASEKGGHVDALVTTGLNAGIIDKGYRDSKRVMIDDVNLAKYFLQRCEKFMPRAYEGGLLLSMNERFRFLKYDEPGNKFAPHCDGCYFRNDYEITTITVQYYLNEGMKGGETTFFHDSFKDGKFACQPKRGRAVFFRQNGWLHEGSELKEGVKYTIRNDILYRWPTEKEISDFKHEECGKCGESTRFITLKSCKHSFLICGCVPFNYYCYGNKKAIIGRCHLCNTPIKFQNEDEKAIKEKALTKPNIES